MEPAPAAIAMLLDVLGNLALLVEICQCIRHSVQLDDLP